MCKLISKNNLMHPQVYVYKSDLENMLFNFDKLRKILEKS